jgi:predicted Zn-dependent peptidase
MPKALRLPPAMLSFLHLAFHLMAQTAVAELPSVDVPEFQKEELPNGLTLLVARHTEQPVIFFSLLVRVGALNEPEEMKGLASIMADMLQEGTENYDSSALARALDELGGSLGVSAGRETTVLSGQTLSRNADRALELLAEMALKPTFPNSSLRRVKQQNRTMLRASYVDSDFIGSRHLSALLYGQSAFGRFPTEQTISKIKRENVTGFYHRHFQPSGAILCALGDFDPPEMIAKLKQTFGDWKKGEAPEAIGLPDNFQYPRGRRLAIKRDKTQATILIGGRGVPANTELSEAFSLANHILGASGFSSRLMNAVRSEEGKTYGVHSSNISSRGAGTFVAHTFTRNDNVKETLNIMLDVIGEAVKDGLTEDELTKAKTARIGQFPLRFENPGNWAGGAVNDIFFGRPLSHTHQTRERIAKITLDQVNDALRKTINMDKLSIIIVGDPKELEGQLDEFGEFEVRREKGDWW